MSASRLSFKSKIIDKLGGHISITRMLKNQHQIPHILNLLYVAIFNLNESNSGNKTLMNEFIVNVKKQYLTHKQSSQFGSFSQSLDYIQKLISTNMNHDNNAKFLMPPNFHNNYEFAEPILKLCQYYNVWGNGFGISEDKMQHRSVLVLNSLKSLLTPGSSLSKFNYLSDLRKQNIDFQIAHGEPELESRDSHTYNRGYLRGVLATINRPYTIVENIFLSAQMGAASKPLAGIVIDYLRGTLPEETMTCSESPVNIQDKPFFVGSEFKNNVTNESKNEGDEYKTMVLKK